MAYNKYNNNSSGYSNHRNGNYHPNREGGKQNNNRTSFPVPEFYNPYTFIPAPKKVLYLNENEKKHLKDVHDIPFSDGHSGRIDVTFRVMTDFCIKMNKRELVKIEGKYIVPGTSVKGMIRNVFEIVTFSDIRQGVHDLKTKLYDFTPRIDLTQSVFGYVNKNDALKGRIQFSHAVVENAKTKNELSVIMGGPKPSFYPFYLQQSESTLINYHNSRAKIAGYKRYLIRAHNEEPPTSDGRTSTKFTPIKAGANFVTSIYYHNLRPYELGALYAAITFCEKNSCFHSLGFAKSYGYGKIKVDNIELYDQYDGDEECNSFTLNDAFGAFKQFIEDKEFTLEDECIKQLQFIATGNYTDKPIRYPELRPGNNPRANEFVAIKKMSPNEIKRFFPQRKQ